MDFDKYDLRINIKTCCLFERLSGKNFFRMSSDEDVAMLLYCSLVTNNRGINITYDAFKVLIGDKKVFKWISSTYQKLTTYMGQFNGKQVEYEAQSGATSEEVITMTDVASTLIVRYGVDPHYVMYEMELWEIEPFFKAADEKVKAELITQRFWTYLTILPNIDGKKVKGPEDLVPFEWEKEIKKKKAEEEIKKNAYAVKHLIGMNINDLLNRKKDG